MRFSFCEKLREVRLAGLLHVYLLIFSEAVRVPYSFGVDRQASCVIEGDNLRSCMKESQNTVVMIGFRLLSIVYTWLACLKAALQIFTAR